MELTADRLSVLLADIVADFCGVAVLAERVTVELRETPDGVLRTALVFDLTEVLFVLLLCTASGLAVRVAPTLAAVFLLFLSERVTVLPRVGFTDELLVTPDFVLTDEFEVFRLVPTVADLLSALFLCVTVALFL